jgi:hypothetical protein
LFGHPTVAGLGLNLTVSSDFLERIARLTALPAGDTTRPMALSATSDGQSVTILFDEVLNPISAAVVGNYSISGVAVTAAALGPDGRTVTLSLGSRITGTFTVRISNVKDLAGNAVAVGTAVTGQVTASSLVFLIDLGGTRTTSHAAAPDDPVHYWNNLTTNVGYTSSGQLLDLVTADHLTTAVDLVMLKRFAGVNENGATNSSLYAADATRDSNYGNTELYNGLSGVFPSFKFRSLDPSWSYTFTFFASRMGVTDNRETGYTVAGANAGFAALNAANNVENVARVSGIRPTAGGEITISIGPTANNNNAFHFTYLNVLRMEGTASH